MIIGITVSFLHHQSTTQVSVFCTIIYKFVIVLQFQAMTKLQYTVYLHDQTHTAGPLMQSPFPEVCLIAVIPVPSTTESPAFTSC